MPESLPQRRSEGILLPVILAVRLVKVLVHRLSSRSLAAFETMRCDIERISLQLNMIYPVVTPLDHRICQLRLDSLQGLTDAPSIWSPISTAGQSRQNGKSRCKSVTGSNPRQLSLTPDLDLIPRLQGPVPLRQ